MVGWQEGHPACKWWNAGMIMCLGQGAEYGPADSLLLTISCSINALATVGTVKMVPELATL